jgi:glycolate oxidase subunit GlcD
VADVAATIEQLLGADAVFRGDPRPYLSDETETRNLVGTCDAVVRPDSPAAVATLVAWAYEHDVPIVARGGGTGYAGGAVPRGGIVVSLERLDRIRSFDPLVWRMHVDAGVTTERVRRTARESGLYFPPDPGAGEQSHIGGNIATNAGGPHAFKYGTTGAWVTGLEAVVPPGEIVRFGGPIRKDVASYDLRSLLVGSEGTLAIVTGAWLRLVPAPEASQSIVAFYANAAAGVEAIETVLGSGLLVAALEYVDAGALAAAPPPFAPGQGEAFAVLVDVDGSAAEVEQLRLAVLEVLADNARVLHAPDGASEQAAVWRWREGMTAGVTALRGGKVSEDIVVPLDRLREAIERTVEIGEAHGLPACSWGHAGDGNLHSTFMIDRTDGLDVERAERAAEALFALAVELGGSISGEHGTGLVKSGHLEQFLPGRGAELHRSVKSIFDPKNLLNPGKKQ